MGLLGRLLGTKPPKVPPGARLIICDNQGLGPFGRTPQWWVAYVAAGDDRDDVSKQHKCSPIFEHLGDAQRWRNWMNNPKGKRFRYPNDAA